MGKWIVLLLLGIAGVYCQTDSSVSEEIGQQAASATNAFGLDLLKILSPDGKNAFFSPLSISVAFALTSLGAKNETLSELSKAFHFDEIKRSYSPSLAIHEDFQNVITTFSKHHSDYNLTLATRLYTHNQVQFFEDFMQNVANYYKASVEEVDFSSGKVEETINHWVNEQTNGCIKELFEPGSLDVNCVLVLVNAIYFKGNWKVEFDAEDTANADFFVTENDTVTVNMMKIVEYFPYVEDDDQKVEVLEMPYAGNDLSMIVILPEQGGISEVISKLSVDNFNSLVNSLQETKVKVKFPRFKLELGYRLEDTLPNLGIHKIFDASQADLSGMSNISLSVTKVIHKSFVEVNEKGTEAAAVTGIEYSARSGVFRQRYPEFIVNRPFVFFIIKKGEPRRILFAGTVNRPTSD